MKNGSRNRFVAIQIAMAFMFLGAVQAAFAETVFVKYRGPVDLKPFACQWTGRSSFIERLCYDKKEHYVLVNLKGTYYHYCGIPESVVNDWLGAPSMGQYYNQNVKGSYDCRVTPPPRYGQ